MAKRFRILGKLALTAVLVCLFLWLVVRDVTVWQLKQPEGEYAKMEDVRILTKELLLAGAEVADEQGILNFCGESGAEYLDYGTYQRLLGYLAADNKEYRYERKYRDEFLMLEKDWYRGYEKLVKNLGLDQVIRQAQIPLLCGDADLAGEERIGQDQFLGSGGEIYTAVSLAFQDCRFTTVKAFVREDRLLVLMEKLPDKQRIRNAWIMECNDQELRFFDGTYEISIPKELLDPQIQQEDLGACREQVADLAFGEGVLKELFSKTEKAGGKLLGLGEGTLEVEGRGVLSMTEDCVGYQLYDKLRTAGVQELRIGYSFADFVLEEGKVCAFLITRKEKMEQIRVAVKDQESGGIYHSELEFASSDVMEVFYGEYDDRQVKQILPGEIFRITKGSEELKGGRVEIHPEAGTGRIEVRSQKRAYGVPSYRGSMEITDTEQGLVLINELPLEEYLYSVVPSEMPASYPLEALKAQAVCARTYGYRYLEHPGYGSVGAHLDDSVSYQVYNNIAENVNSTRAVKETSGKILYCGEEPVNTYYYSTSCGFGGDAGVWNEQQKEGMPYLKSIYIGSENEEEGEIISPADLTDEECFREYITKDDPKAYEREEPWFRWRCVVEELDVSVISDRLKERYQAAPDKILFQTQEGQFEKKEPEKIREIYEIRCGKRKEGGVMDELLLDTDRGTYMVVSEYNIRYVLNQGKDVIRQDGSSYQSSALLPSAYMIIDTVKSGENVVGYTVTGGGYGHGVGMSQNGARSMGLLGMDCEGILAFYFGSCRMENMY